MSKSLTFLFLFLIVLYSCNKEQSATASSESADYKKGESFFYKQNDSAFYYFNRAVGNSKDSLEIAMAYNYMAAIQADAGDNFGSQESLLSSLKYLNIHKKLHRSCLSSDYNELGRTSVNLKNYDAAIGYYDQAILYADYEEYRLMALNNKALALQKKKDYKSAIHIYSTIIARTKKGGREYARVLSNLTRTRWLLDPSYNAAPALHQALQIRRKEKDHWGENASLAHLADYYTASQPDSALYFAQRMLTVAKHINSADDQIDALRKLINLLPAQSVKRYFTIYQSLSDSITTARNAAKNQFALIRYESEKTKSDNLRLQKDNTAKEYRLFKQNLILFAVLFLMISGAIIAVLWYKKRRRRLETAAAATIRENQLKTSKKVHDVVANGLYRMMSEVENKPVLDKENLLDQIELLYDQSRDISYEQPQQDEQLFHQKLTGILLSFATANTKVVLSGNRKDLWEAVTDDVGQELCYVLQELMVNMRKHSSASHVALKFEKKNQRINIYYTDNGVGFPVSFKQKNGLTNTGNRMESIHGVITFGPNAKRGARIMISFPVA